MSLPIEISFEKCLPESDVIITGIIFKYFNNKS